MAIQIRRGFKRDFNPQKMLPGEWAVSTDPETQNQIIWMCFRAGVVKRMGTYEDFKEQIREATADVKEEYKQTFNEIKVYMEWLKNTTEGYKNTASQKATQASNSATQASKSASGASTSAANAADSAAASENYSKLSESWAHGETGLRAGENESNSKFFAQLAESLTNEARKLLDQAQKIISAAVSGALIPAGTAAFENLPVSPVVGYMYNISNDFTTDDRFAEGAGIFYRAGANVYWTADGKWDVLAGASVSGVKGSSETEYRTGLVNITPDDIGIQEIGKTLKGYTLAGADSDMDDYKIPGNYCVYASNLASVRNKPAIPDNTAACIFRVEEGYTNGPLASKPAVRQRFQQFLRPYIWERCLYDESWTDWELVQTSEPLNIQSGWSLSGGTEIAENADLNDPAYLEIGNYYCPGNAALQNCPVTDAFAMKVSTPGGAGYKKQTIIAENTGDMWIRVFDDAGTIVKDWTLIAADQSKKVDASKIVESAEITEPGFLMDGKTASEKFTAINEELSGKQNTITGGASSIASSNLAAKRALISNAAGTVAVASTTVAELEYLHGVKSNVQTQINNINTIKGKNGANSIQFLWGADMTCTLYVDNTRIGTLNYTK